MKLNYREKVILAIVGAIAICLAGFFCLIKPKNQDIKDHKAELKTKQEEKAQLEQKIARIEPLKDEIDETYQNTKKLTDDFVDASLISSPDKLDQYMQQLALNSEIEVVEVNVDALKTSTIDYYYRSYETLLSSMMTSADLNGDYAAAEAKLAEESAALSQRTAEEAISTEYGVMLKGTKEQIFKYLEEVIKLNNTTLVKSVEITDYTFGANDEEDEEKNNQRTTTPPAEPAEGEQAEGEEGAEVQQPEEQEEVRIPSSDSEEVSDGTSTVKIVISLYSVYDMPKPNTDA